ncbi:MAG: sugar transferase [Acidobacteriota bacterium]
MLLESPELLRADARTGAGTAIKEALFRSTRSTDIKGWHRDGAVIGVLFTEISLSETSIIKVLSGKVSHALRDIPGAEQPGGIALSFYSFPDDSANAGTEGPGLPAISTMYPDLILDLQSKRIQLLFKRCLDVVASALALLLLTPVLAVIAAAVKLSSRGPVLFRQKRLGQYGRSFTFLKFRSMYSKNDHAIHEAYIKEFISNRTGTDNHDGSQVYKLKGDPRVTRVGRFLRRTSLDELPQFLNVLAGHMSLVGPRPPVPYEFDSYEIWHRRRLLAVKPGITGFWQVEGRSRVKFDEMVRMDLEYARTWSIWLDLKILLQTPAAVLGGAGAY